MSQVSDYTSYQNSLQRLRDSYETERADSRASNDEKLESVKARAEETIKSAKTDYSSRLEEERAQAREEVKKLKDDLYDQRGKSQSGESKEIQEERKALSKYHDDIQKQSDKRVEQAKEYTRAEVDRLHEQSANKVEDAVTAQKKSHRQEVNDLQGELQQYKSGDRDIEFEKAFAKQKILNETEGEQLKEKQQIVSSYDRQIKRLRDHEEELQDNYNRKLNDSSYANQDRTQAQLMAQRSAFNRIEKDQAQERGYLEKNHQIDMDSVKGQSVRSSENLIAKHTEDMDHVINNKDQIYTDYISSKDAKTRLELAQRDAKITELQTTDNSLKVSPFVVEKINQAAEKRSMLALNEAQAVHQKNLDAARNRDSEDRKDLSEKYKTEFADLSRSSRREMDLQSRQVRDTAGDMESTRTAEVSDLKESKRKLGESLYQKNAMELEAAQKQKKEALLDQRETLILDKNASLDDAQNSMRAQDREWFIKVNDLRRNFEQKLTDEREAHEKLTLETKLENDKKLRSLDRLSHRTLDDRVRSFEHQITQQELAFKEKERFLTEHYEEELDKMKRTNAHLIEKKS